MAGFVVKDAAMRAAFVFSIALVACNTPVRPERAQGDGTAAPLGTESPSDGASAKATASGFALAAPQPIPEGPPGKIVLTSGATLDLPAGSVLASAPTELPSEVKRAQVWKFPDESRLMVNELTPTAGSCDAELDKEWAKMKAAQADNDPERLKFRRVESVEKIDLDGRRALFSASTHGTGNPGESASLATLLLCTPTDYVVAMLAAKKSDVPTDTKTPLVSLVKSYKAK
jgi:hypothetical protein